MLWIDDRLDDLCLAFSSMKGKIKVALADIDYLGPIAGIDIQLKKRHVIIKIFYVHPGLNGPA